MKVVISGVAPDGTVTGPLNLQFEVPASGETLPPLSIGATGGLLTVWRSQITVWGNVYFHLFGSDKGDETLEKGSEK